MSYEGDKYLSGNDRAMWDLLYEALIRYKTIVIFKHRNIDVPKKQPELIEYFVDANSEYYLETVQFLQDEGKKFESSPQKGWPGTVVSVLPFEGLIGHMDRNQSKKLADDVLNSFYDSLLKRSAGDKYVTESNQTKQ